MIRIRGTGAGYLGTYIALKSRLYLDGEQGAREPAYGGKMAARFGMTGEYSREVFLLAAVGRYRLDGRGPYVDVRYHSSGTKTEDGVTRDVHTAIEVLVSPPKSWSIAAHLAPPALQGELHAIMDAARNRAMERMEELVRVRVTRAGETTLERPLGIQWTAFRHSTTRRGDPDMHDHIIVCKQVMCADGQIRTIDESSWVRINFELDAYYKAELARLAAEAGWGLDITEHGPELRCVSHEARRAFSSAREEMRAFLATHGIDIEKATESARTWANLATRLGKIHFDEAHVERVYRAKLAAAGLDYDALAAGVRPGLESGYTLRAPRSAQEAVLLALEELHERSDVIRSRHELLLVAAKYGGYAHSGAALTAAVDTMLEQGYLMHRVPQRAGERETAAGATLTSQYAVERERAAVAYFRNAAGRGSPATTAERAEAAMLAVEAKIAASSKPRPGAAAVRLTEGQRAMVYSALGLAHHDRIAAVRGDPGTGKTTGMEATRLAAEGAGWTVLGLAPSDQARDALQGAGIKTETIQLATKSEAWWDQVRAKTLLIVDEAGMVDSRQMNVVLERAQAKGARVVLVGDYEQVQSVEAGTPFERICKAADRVGSLVELTEMSRARNPSMQSLHQLSRDDQAAAIRLIMDGGPAGHAFSSPSADARYAYVAEQWLKLDQESRHRVPIVVDTNCDRHAVTDAIRRRMHVESVYSVSSFESLQLERAKHLTAASYEPGLAIRMNSKSGPFGKGQTLRVESVTDGVIVVRTERGDALPFLPDVHGRHATLGEYETTHLGVGDIVRFAAKWQDAGVRNGDRGLIRTLDSGGQATIDFIGYDGQVRDTKQLDLSTPGISVRHGIASTVHGVQGASIDAGIYLASKTSRNSFLVGVTRFKRSMTLVTDASTQRRLEAFIERAQTRQYKAPALPTKADLGQRFRRISVNAAWPAVRAADGRETTAFTPFPKAVPMSEAAMREFLHGAQREYGSMHVTGSRQFVALAQHVAEQDGLAGRITYAAQHAKAAPAQSLPSSGLSR